jgi:hypothetical protein
MSAFVPFYEAGYRLMISVLIAGMLPYIVYGIVVPLLQSTMTTIAGLVIVIAHVFLVINERLTGKVDYSDSVIYFGPIFIAVTILPLVMIAIRKSRKTYCQDNSNVNRLIMI